ncbi:putative membrane protein, MmpL family [Mycolicibacterium madagascariense]|uniref:Putative membrane protein, MmpL family n=1 Tax=Mycolicibacterium madagascariense TaxID=212765 RepID=A0A7I7X8K5_9MYCO|nr:MMPL family transporter [Mycolicibacterium madagascariense]MCV7013397.1 MMPL family transporter [Mycolicibacterium madagascariense]BBZ25884.1 putative membrane protein, MmpL family [Mycolicibacterium madagascariense]
MVRRPHREEAHSRRLAAVARYAVTHRGIVIGGWLGVAVVLALLFPQLETVVQQQSLDPIPRDVASFQTLDRMGRAFGEEGSTTTVVVAMEDPAGLGPQARSRYAAMVSALRADSQNVEMVQDLLADPVTAGEAVSADGKAWYVPVGIHGTLGGPRAAESVASVRRIAARAFDGTSTVTRVTGPAATMSDQIVAAERDLLYISLATAGLIAAILLLVYRSVFTAMLPLLVIGTSLGVGRGVLSALGELGMPVSQFTIAFMTVILLGAGTDYSVFLISRYHEQRRRGVAVDEAVINATATIGRVVLASAATVALAFVAMAFAKLTIFATSGPACAVAVVVGCLATVTLLPPVLVLAAKRGIGEPRQDRTRAYWNRIAVTVVRKPVPLLVISLVLLLAFGGVALTLRMTYDDRKGQPATTASNEGYRLLDRHFPKDVIISEFLLVESPTDLRTGRGLADLEEMASRVAQIPGVDRVVGVTRPTGQRLDQAQLSWQNGRIGDKLADAVAGGDARKGDLSKLAAGADRLADGLTQLDGSVRSALTPLTGLLDEAGHAGQTIQRFQPALRQLNAMGPNVDRLVEGGTQIRPLAERAASAIAVIDPLAAALGGSPLCAATPECGSLRDHVQTLIDLRDAGFFDQVANLGDEVTAQTAGAPASAMIAQLQSAATTLERSMTVLGGPGADLPAQMARLQGGIGQLASGARALAVGVHTLVDSNLEMLGGMSRVAAQLQDSARATSGSDAATGFYLPPTALRDQRFAEVARHFISSDGKTARFAIESGFDPYSAEAMRLDQRITGVARAATPNTSLADATVSMAGFPAINFDVQRLMVRDFLLLAIATLAIVALILGVLLQAVLAPIYLLATVVLNYAAALGMGVLVFQYGLGHDISWPVPLLSFIILVAVGADYNMLLISRLREESANNIRVGVMRTVASTGSVITSAGLIFAASMFGLMVGSIEIMVQMGFVIGCGLLLDTFVVRTVTVPAIATLLGEASWWPKHRS